MPAIGCRVKDTTTSTGTGNLTLSGTPPAGFLSFNGEFGTNTRFLYIIDDGAGNWESGVGYLSASTTLVRDTPFEGSASVPISFGAGTKTVFCDATDEYLERSANNRRAMLTTGRFML